MAAVTRLHRRSARVAERRFVVEGPQAVREALRAAGLLELFAVDLADPLAQQASASGVRVTAVSEPVLAAMAETVTPQGLLGTAALLDVPLAALPAAPRLVVVLDAVADPGNAGTVLRTADAAGADAVVLTAGSTDPHGGKAVRASAGSLWHLPVVCGAPLDEVIAFLQAKGVQVLATSGSTDEQVDDLDDLEDSGVLTGPVAWVFGTEAHGLPAQSLAAADRRVRIRLQGQAESLNLAAAAAVCLFATARSQRRHSS